MQNEDIQQINPDEIEGYLIKRSPTSHFKFNAYAVNSDGDLQQVIWNLRRLLPL